MLKDCENECAVGNYSNGNYYTSDGQPVDLFYKIIRDNRKTDYEIII